MDSHNAIEANSAGITALWVELKNLFLCPDCEDPVDPDFRKCTRCDVLFSDYAHD